MRSNLGRYLTAAFVLLLATLILTGTVFRAAFAEYVKNNKIAELRQDAQVLGELVEAAGVDGQLTGQDFYVALTVAHRVSGADAVICDSRGILLLCTDSPMGCEHVGKILSASYLESCRQSGGRVDTGIIEGLYTDRRHIVSQVLTTESGDFRGLVIVSQSVDDLSLIVGKIIQQFVMISILTECLMMVVVTVFVRRQSKPLRDMARIARAFGHGDLESRVESDRHNTEEVQELALAFNNMASSLQNSEYRRQEFVANVSHELKTPMTTISGFVDGILDGTIPPEKERQYLQLVSEETKRLSRLVRSMLDISRLESMGDFSEEQLQSFDLSEMTGQTLVGFEQKITQKGLEVQADFPNYPVYARAVPDAINQVIYNLLDNAIKFSPQGGTLAVRVQQSDKKCYVSISNQGQTIPAEELPLVFDRFHKIDKSRSVNRDSWGLGLYIVKTILDFHRENISVTSRDGITTCTFTLAAGN